MYLSSVGCVSLGALLFALLDRVHIRVSLRVAEQKRELERKNSQSRIRERAQKKGLPSFFFDSVVSSAFARKRKDSFVLLCVCLSRSAVTFCGKKGQLIEFSVQKRRYKRHLKT